MVENGGYVVMIDVDNTKGGLKLNPDFFVDFGAEPNGPMLPHEIRYPGVCIVCIVCVNKFSSMSLVNYSDIF